MAGRIRRGIRVRLRTLFGFVKDKAAVGRARATSRFTNLHVALICATSHEEAPSSQKYVQTVLRGGTGSRLRMSYCIRLLMDRLNKTKNWAVAMKCLTLIHNGLRSGRFIFQDQLSFYPARGGRNYLNLARFRDRSSPFAWEASSWIRWYANFLEQRLITCRIVGTSFPDSKWSHSKIIPDRVSALENHGLVREVSTLADLLQEICECPMKGSAASNGLVKEALRFVILDGFKTQDELKVRLREVYQRLNSLTTLQVSRFVQVCERLSTESMSWIHLIDSGLALDLFEPSQFPEKILFIDYELRKMKEALQSWKHMSVPSVQ